MNLDDLGYFIAVAESQNMNQAAKKVGVSPATLSRSVGKLEEMYGVELFLRIGKNVEINNNGRLLLTRARSILEQVNGLQHELTHSSAKAELKVAGRPMLMTKIASSLAHVWQNRLNLMTRFTEKYGTDAIESVRTGESNFCVTIQKPQGEFHSKELLKFKMVVCCSKSHPLAKLAGPIPVQKLLEYEFVTPDVMLSDEGEGKKGMGQDAWYDGLYPRKSAFMTDSAMVKEELCRSGKVLAYLPDYRAEVLDVKVLNVTGYEADSYLKIYLSMRKTLQAPYVVAAFQAITGGNV